MPTDPRSTVPAAAFERRAFLKHGLLAAGVAAAGPALVGPTPAHAQAAKDAAKAARPTKPPTKFIHACMTLPYGQFPLMRALSGIKSAGSPA